MGLLHANLKFAMLHANIGVQTNASESEILCQSSMFVTTASLKYGTGTIQTYSN